MRKPALLATLALSACAAAPAAEGPTASDAVCNSEGLAAIIGQPFTEELGKRMLRDSGARTLRNVAPGTMVTMDFSAQRLTVYLTADNRIERASCG